MTLRLDKLANQIVNHHVKYRRKSLQIFQIFSLVFCFPVRKSYSAVSMFWLIFSIISYKTKLNFFL